MAEHGTAAGYAAGCHEICCRRGKKAARVAYELAVAQGHEFQVPGDRTRRKVRALAALGWTAREVAERMTPPISQQAISKILMRPVIRATTAERIDRVYEKLEMVIPPDTPYHRRRKTEALARGWLPPLAYDDIDAGIVAEVEPERWGDRFDEDEIEYALQYHDFSRKLNPREKAEIVRRWVRAGGTERQLCQLTGWREGRYR